MSTCPKFMYPTHILDTDADIASHLPSRDLAILRQVNRYFRDLIDQDTIWKRRSDRLGLSPKPNLVSWRDWSRVWEPRGPSIQTEIRTDPIGSLLQLSRQEAGIRLLAQDGIYVPGSERYQTLTRRLIGTMNDSNSNRRMAGLSTLVQEYSRKAQHVDPMIDIPTVDYYHVIRRAIKTGCRSLIQPIIDDFVKSTRVRMHDREIQLLAQLDLLDEKPSLKSRLDVISTAIGRIIGRYPDAPNYLRLALRSITYHHIRTVTKLFRSVFKYLPTSIPDVETTIKNLSCRGEQLFRILAIEGVRVGRTDIYASHLDPCDIFAVLANRHPRLAEQYFDKCSEVDLEDIREPIFVSDRQLIQKMKDRSVSFDLDYKRCTPEAMLDCIGQFEIGSTLDDAFKMDRYDLIEVLMQVRKDLPDLMYLESIYSAAESDSIDLLITSIMLHSSTGGGSGELEYGLGEIWELCGVESRRVIAKYLEMGNNPVEPNRLLQVAITPTTVLT